MAIETPAPEQQAVGSWDEFVAEFVRLVPGLTVSVGPDIQLGELLSGDRILKGLVSAALRQLLHTPPDELLSPETTLREVYEWSLIRARSAETTAKPAANMASVLKHMRTANVRLRPIQDSDYPEMYASALDPRWSYRWRYRGATPSMQDFVATLSQGVLAQFIVERLIDRRAIGLVTCYDARTDIGWAYIAFTRVSSPTSADGAEMLEGGFVFISFLFRNWNLRKLYAEVPGWNWSQFEKGSGEFFTVEGVLKDHEYFDGQFWDSRIVALHRTTWETTAVPLLASLYGTGS